MSDIAAEGELLLCYGGTFDPVHQGHLAIARAARDELRVPVHLVPAADPPHRPAPGADAAQRAQMLALAIEGEPGLLLDLRELQRAQRQERPSYTVDTLRELRDQCGARRPLAWLLGADSFVALPQWHAWESLLDLAHLVIADRPGSAIDAALPPALAAYARGRWAGDAGMLSRQPAGCLWRLDQPLRTESASEVRARIAAGADWRPLVPPAVAAFIAAEGLYGYNVPAA